MLETIKQWYADSKKEYQEIGGWSSLTSGTWLAMIVQKSFSNYWNTANTEYFYSKYKTHSKHAIAKKLIAVAAKNAAILGGISGAAISADELVALSTAAEGGIGLPANLTIAAVAIGGEAIGLLKIQLKLVAELGKIFGVPLDPEDPEDILIILAYSLGGSVSDAVGKFGAKVGGRAAGRAVKSVISKEVLAAVKSLFQKVGIKILQRTIVKTTIPIVSIAISSGWNYTSTRTVGKIAIKHFESLKY